MDFDEIVDQYGTPVYNLVYRLIGDREEAADLTQDTFVAAYRSIESFRRESTVYTWLCRIAVNKCRNKLKQQGRVRRYEAYSLDTTIDGQDGPEAAVSTSTDGSPEAELERKELRERLEWAITQLPPDYRIVAVLRDLHGLSYEQIAEATDLSVDVVRVRLSRARGMLRRKLEAYLTEGS